MARIKAIEISTMNSGFNFPLANSPSGQIQFHSIWVSIFLTLSISCQRWKMVSLHTVIQDHVGCFRWSKERMYICKQATLVQGIKLSQHINTALFNIKKKKEKKSLAFLKESWNKVCSSGPALYFHCKTSRQKVRFSTGEMFGKFKWWILIGKSSTDSWRRKFPRLMKLQGESL